MELCLEEECRLCGLTISSMVVMQQHYEGKIHSKKVGGEIEVQVQVQVQAIKEKWKKMWWCRSRTEGGGCDKGGGAEGGGEGG